MDTTRCAVLVFMLMAICQLEIVSAQGPTVAPVLIRQAAHFPNVYATPNPSPWQLVLTNGAHNAMVEVELLEEVAGIALCIQRSMSTPVDVVAWPSCTYSYAVSNQVPTSVFEFNVTDVEGNIPYYVNLVLQSPGVSTASANVYVAIESCPLGQTRGLHHPGQCYTPVALLGDEAVTFNVSSTKLTQYFTVTAPNNNPNNLVTGMDITLGLPQGVAWKFYAAANMPPTPDGWDFFASSILPEYETGSFHISTPSPGVWYLVLALTDDAAHPEYIGTISRRLESSAPEKLGPEITTDNKLIVGPEPNLPHTLRLFHVFSGDGSLYISLSVLHPRELETHPLPYKLFVAVNAAPGSFNASIDSQGLNIFADWIGCSLNPANCTSTTIVKMPATGQRCTYIIGVLPVGNFTGSQFVLWRDSMCPFCERGICQVSGAEFGSCKCPRGWTQIDCAKWGEKSLTPQTIVIIAVMSFFAVFGVVTLIYILYSKRAKLFPSKYGPTSEGYEDLGVNADPYEGAHVPRGMD